MPSVESLPAVLITAPDRPLHDHDRALWSTCGFGGSTSSSSDRRCHVRGAVRHVVWLGTGDSRNGFAELG